MEGYFERDNSKINEFIYFLRKDKCVSFIDFVPERYKRKEYIIDKIKSK